MTLACRELTHEVPGRVLYRDLTGRFPEGRITAVIGPNGAGKSTLLAHLAGLWVPQRGAVTIADHDLRALPPRQRARRIADRPPHTDFSQDLSVEDVVMLGRAPHQGRFAPPETQDVDAVNEALGRVGALGLRHRGVLSLSGGERQRVNLARMLATGAEVLILDEPTASLDVAHALGLLELLRSLAGRGQTIVLAMHELSWARRVSHETLCLGDPGARHWGTTAEVMTPARLSEIFAVRVEETAGEVIFYPKESATP